MFLVHVLEIATEVMPGESIGLDVSFMRDDTLTVVDELRITSDDPLGNDVVLLVLSGRSVAPVHGLWQQNTWILVIYYLRASLVLW